MADSDKNILITPNTGSTTDSPKIEFTGGGNNTVTLTTLDDGTLSFSGSSGQLFSISDSLTGTIFSVNDVSGIPSIEVEDDGTVRLAEFGGNLLIGTDVDTNSHKMQLVSGVSQHPLYIESAFSDKIKLKSTNTSVSGNGIDFYNSDDKLTGSLRTSWSTSNKYTELYQNFDTAADQVRRVRLKPGDHPKAVYGSTEYNIFNDNYHPNADKWTTASTITLSGDLTGSVSLDGSSNVTLSAQVVNNSHTHDDRYYTESELNHTLARSFGWVPAYSNANEDSVSWNFSEDAVEIKDPAGDSAIGAAYKAIRVKQNQQIRFTVQAKGSVAGSSGFYLRIYQYNGILPDGKTHVSNDASYGFVQEDSSGDSGWWENNSITTTWKQYTRLYTAPADGYVSLVALNWTGYTGSIFIKEPHIEAETVYYASAAGTASSATSAGYATNAGNADTVDSLQASSFLRSDANDSYSGNITATGNNWYLWSLGARGASAGEYGIGNRSDMSYRQLTFHVPNIAAYSSTGVVPSFGWYSNGAKELMRLNSDSGDLSLTGGLTINGSISSGATDYGYYQGAGTNIILKGDGSGRSGIFFESEKNGTNINDPSDYGFIQFHSYGFNGSSGEANVLAIGVANDSTDTVVIQAPYKGGVKIGYRDSTSGTGLSLGTVWHSANDGPNSGLDADLLDGQHASAFAAASHNHDDRYYTESEIQTFMNRGFVSGHSASNLPVGWYTIATNTGDRASARFGIWDGNSGDHQSVTFYASHHFGTDSSNTLTVLDNSYYGGNPFRHIRIKDAGTYDGAALQIYIDDASNSVSCAILGDNFQSSGWVLCDWIPDATTPPNVSNYANFGERSRVDLNQIAQGGFATTGEIYAGGDTTLYRVFHDNYHPSADYATSAGNADTLDGQHASAFVTNSGLASGIVGISNGGAIGSYIIAMEMGIDRSARNLGDTIAGGSLRPASILMSNTPSVNTNAISRDVIVAPGSDDNSTLSGTWRLMGAYADSYTYNDYPMALWLRIS